MKFTKRTMFLALVLAVAMMLSSLAGCTKSATAPSAGTDTATQSGSSDEPVTITWATLAGFYTDWVSTLAAEYTEKTGVQVNIVEMDLPTMYEKEVLDIVGGTGAYDIITWNVSWKGEWANAGYMLPLDDYIAKDNAEVQIEDFPSSMLQVCAEWNNKLYGLPYYTFTPGLIYRADLFEDPTEMANFKAKYGYDLDIPKTYDEMSDIAEFFTRKAGDLLKGEPLTQDMYGIGLMAGRYTNIFDEINTIAWTYGGDVINDDGTTGVQSEAYTRAVNTYVNDLLPYAPAGSLSGSYDFVISQFNTGIVAMTGPMYLDQWANAVKVETNIPGSEAQCAGLPGGGKTWAGAFTIGIASSTKHSEEAWDFLKYITGKDAQRAFAEGGGSTCRLSILNDTEWVAARRDKVGHFPVLANILEDGAKNWYTNYIWITEGAKIYEESPGWLSAAASGEMTVDEALAGFAKAIDDFTGGKATIYNEGVVKPESGGTYMFDKSIQLRK